MTEKVKVTQEVAEALAIRLDKGFPSDILRHHIIDRWNNPINKSLNDLSIDDLAKALYIGYEVEPEYEYGELIYSKRASMYGTFVMYKDGLVVTDMFEDAPDGCRHATELEIAQAKERRWWSNHGREVDEYRLYDIVRTLSGSIGVITAFESKGIGESLVEINDCASFKTERIRLICPFENRQDISHE